MTEPAHVYPHYISIAAHVIFLSSMLLKSLMLGQAEFPSLQLVIAHMCEDSSSPVLTSVSRFLPCAGGDTIVVVVTYQVPLEHSYRSAASRELAVRPAASPLVPLSALPLLVLSLPVASLGLPLLVRQPTLLHTVLPPLLGLPESQR